MPVGRRAKLAPPPPRPWPSSVPLGQYGASSRPRSTRRSSAAMSGAAAVAASSRHPQRVRHATACRPLKAQQKFTNMRATCLSLVWWLWWFWCGPCTLRVCLSIRASGMQRINMDWRHCTSPFGWTDQPETSHACSLREQVPGVPRCKTSPNPKARKKIARLAHLTSLSNGGRGAQSFPSPRSWMPRIRIEMRSNTWTCLSGKPDPSTHITTCIQEMTRSNEMPFTTPITYPG